MSLTSSYAAVVRKALSGWPAEPQEPNLNSLLRLLARWRSTMLANTYIAREGEQVWSGPFKGMAYVDHATEGALMPRLLGTYESELHPHLEAFAEERLDCVIDVGCAEGYYAVGLARLLPGATVHAHDISERARAACAALAVKNGVADRVRIGGEFRPEDFQAFAGRRTLVVVDIEGAEAELLRPDLSPALAEMRLIVETHHDRHGQRTHQRLIERFSPTHEVVRVDQRPKTFDPPAWFADLNHLDHVLATWEFRGGPTPWLVMRPRG
jgi:hypothetical protein